MSYNMPAAVLLKRQVYHRTLVDLYKIATDSSVPASAQKRAKDAKRRLEHYATHVPGKFKSLV
jgi:uncharacterized protein (UPF0147 family)